MSPQFLKKKEEHDSPAKEDGVDATNLQLEKYIEKLKERLIIATETIRKKNTAKTRKQKWEEKHLYGNFLRPTGEIASEIT